MKCPEYDPDDYGCMSPFVLGRCPNITPNRNCRLGWITFWTPAERAGLKAIGQEYKFRTRLFVLTRPYFAVKETGIFMIHAYVRAARKVKERLLGETKEK